MPSKNMWLGIGIGAMLAFMADPRGGRRRRALIRDQFIHGGRKMRDALDATRRHLTNRTSGMIAVMRRRWADDGTDDYRLVERVRAALGRVCSHPHAVEVHSAAGHVTLRGRILLSEMRDLVNAIERVRGVKAVTNELAVPHSADSA